jgi:hypothetical protein
MPLREIPPGLPKGGEVICGNSTNHEVFSPFEKREAVKKFRNWESGNPYHVQGRGKFTPPKKAPGSPLPTDN